MKLKCETCREEVGEGNIENIENKKKLFLKGELKGELHRNKSSDPEKWTCLCSSCQKVKKDT
jgi:hypothetical protein